MAHGPASIEQLEEERGCFVIHLPTSLHFLQDLLKASCAVAS